MAKERKTRQKKEAPKAGDFAPIPQKLVPLKMFSDGVFSKTEGNWVKGSKGEKKVEVASLPAGGAIAKRFDPAPLIDFNYTTASVRDKRTAKERRAHGCAEKPDKQGQLKFTGKRIDGTSDSFCQGTSPPCDQPRKACPVQLVWVKGKPNLRFCRTLSKPGYLVPVDSPEEGYAMSKKACAKWGGWPENYFNDNAPEVVERATKAYPAKGGLGGSDEPPSFGRSALWLLGGATLAFVITKMLKKNAEVPSVETKVGV